MELPEDFIQQTRALLGDESYAELSATIQTEPPVSIRLNTRKLSNYTLIIPKHQSGKKIPWCSDGYYQEQRLNYTFDPLFHAGCYYAQEASSMFLEQVIKQYVQEPVIMLDLCAAPGGKSTHARSLLPEGSLLVANEIIHSRARVLAENITKWGHPDVVITNNDPEDFKPLGAFFDIVLADVPCSGEGMFRKDAGAVEEWNLENVEICWQRQRRIIADIWPCIKPNGILIYSTCTYNTKENEENATWIQQQFGAEPLQINVSEEWGITGNLANTDIPVYRFLPHKTKGEGFFLTVLRKPSDTDKQDGHKQNKNKKDTIPSTYKAFLAMIKGLLSSSDEYRLTVTGNLITAFPKIYMDKLSILQRTLHVLQAGIAIGELKGKDFIPQHAAAMSSLLRKDAFPIEEVNYEQAITYLRKEAIILSENTPRGFVEITYKGVPLGFVKNLGKRANNLYPQDSRIRSGYLPEEIRTLQVEIGYFK